jgi:hypothetical protein
MTMNILVEIINAAGIVNCMVLLLAFCIVWCIGIIVIKQFDKETTNERRIL